MDYVYQCCFVCSVCLYKYIKYRYYGRRILNLFFVAAYPDVRQIRRHDTDSQRNSCNEKIFRTSIKTKAWFSDHAFIRVIFTDHCEKVRRTNRGERFSSDTLQMKLKTRSSELACLETDRKRTLSAPEAEVRERIIRSVIILSGND